MKKTLLLIILAFGISSCSNSDSNPQVLDGILIGSFIEVTPVNNRTTLIFSSDSNQLHEKRVSDEENTMRTFSTRLLDDNMIELSSNEADEMSSRVLHYKIIDNNEIEIGSVNKDDPENTIMTFVRN